MYLFIGKEDKDGLGRGRGSTPREKRDTLVCVFCSRDTHHGAVRDWRIELSESQGIGRWAGIGVGAMRDWWMGCQVP